MTTRSIGRLYIDGYNAPILFLKELITQQTDYNGMPSSIPQGGVYEITIPDIARWMHLFDNWALSKTMMKNCIIEVQSWDGTTMLKKLEFRNTHCIRLDYMDGSADGAMYYLTLSAGTVVRNGEVIISKWWGEDLTTSTPVSPTAQEDTDKQWTTTFIPNTDDRKNGIYGWDQWSQTLQDNCTSDQTKYKESYTWITVGTAQYTVPKLSMRVGQTITLSLKHKTKNPRQYNSVVIEPHPDFDIHPLDIKNADEVTIRCLNNGDISQIRVLADNNPAGALEIWHPVPKTATLRWVFVEIEGGLVDFRILEKLITKQKLEAYFKKAFNPALIDIKIVNKDVDILDIYSIKERIQNKEELTTIDKLQQGYLKKLDESFKSSDNIKSAISEKINLLIQFNRLSLSETRRGTFNEITLYLTYLRSVYPDGYSNGISLTGRGISAMFLKNKLLQTSVEIPHEIMHAIGLEHTFTTKDANGEVINEGQAHTFKKGMTTNYMDYNNDKEHTQLYQWKKLHNSKYTK
ncbi:type VI secretion system tube protein TssD [Aquimarina longa]|uniref:type VI secretion system tube protein TssD n=1 Tax=Aquimarina longa TaxID=1080221 RepID=UPI000AA01871|nr:type VI secretion system tube protein TssD [Aquimarina longa]